MLETELQYLVFSLLASGLSLVPFLICMSPFRNGNVYTGSLYLRSDRTIMPPFYISVAILSSGLTSWKMEPFPMIVLPFNKNSHTPRQAPPLLETPAYAQTSCLPYSIKGHAWPGVGPCAIFLQLVRLMSFLCE
jgi:hypothetical protein